MERLPVAVALLTDPGLSHMEAVTQRRLQITAIQYRRADRGLSHVEVGSRLQYNTGTL
jgi:hypothetical protein